MLSHRENVRTSKFWKKSNRIFVWKLTKGIYGFDLGQTKIQNYLMLVYL